MELSMRVPVALASTWDDLPRLVGPEWTDLYPRVAEAITRLAAAGDAERPAAVVALATLFRPFPAAAAVLRTAFETGSRHGDPSATGSQPRWTDVMRDLQLKLDSPTETAWTEVFATRRLAVGQRGVVTASLSRTPQGHEALPVSVCNLRHVDVHLLAPRTRLEGPSVRRITAEGDGTFDIAAFSITAVVEGVDVLRVEYRHGGMLLASVRCAVQVEGKVDGNAATEREPDPEPLPPAALLFGGPYAPPPDLELRVLVETRDGRTVLRYYLHSPNGAADHHHQPVGEITLTGSPDEQRDRLLGRIERINQPTGGDAEERLRAVGERLYREMLPAQFRTAYARLGPAVRSLQITSDEPWIPWELVRPFDDTVEPAVDDDFWAARFELSRWLTGSAAPRGSFRINRMACVAVPNAAGLAHLPAVVDEDRWLAAFAAAHGVSHAGPIRPDRRSLGHLLEDPQIDLWHFAGHGNIDPDRAEEASLTLVDGEVWEPDDLHGSRQAGVSQARPVVVLNACRVGTQGWSLSRLGGWVEAWVLRCRSGAFIGPQWSIMDGAAAAFMRSFYTDLARGRTLAAAVCSARTAVRASFPGDPTWLAFALYGHPNARTRWGSSAG